MISSNSSYPSSHFSWWINIMWLLIDSELFLNQCIPFLSLSEIRNKLESSERIPPWHSSMHRRRISFEKISASSLDWMFHKFVSARFLPDNPHKSTDNVVEIFHEKKNLTFFSPIEIIVAYLCDNGFLPGSVGGLHAPTNWILSRRIHVWSEVR